jgi:hypothetical protein
MPGESPAVFGDALRRLATAATYLYQDGARYWFSTQATVTKIAEDRAEQFIREPEKVAKEIEGRVRADVRKSGDFNRVHPFPQSGHEIGDDTDARLVVLGIDHAYTKEADNAALTAAKAMLAMRGNTPRLFQNTLVFLAIDQIRLQDLDEAVRRYLAWESIVTDAESGALELTTHQIKQAKEQKDTADGIVAARLPEAYQWLLVATQASPQSVLDWKAFRLAGQDPLAVRASKKLRNDELLVTVLAGTVLRMPLDRVPLWRGDHVAVKQLVEDFARYLYLPRLVETKVLLDAIGDGLSLFTWEQDSFAYADSYDETSRRYRGLRYGQRVTLADTSTGLLVKAEVASRQVAAETAAKGMATTSSSAPPETVSANGNAAGDTSSGGLPLPLTAQPRRFHGSVTLEATRVGRDAGRIADEVISHLAGLVGADVKVTLEISADVQNGVSEKVVRTVTENCRTLKFKDHGFEES